MKSEREVVRANVIEQLERAISEAAWYAKAHPNWDWTAIVGGLDRFNERIPPLLDTLSASVPGEAVAWAAVGEDGKVEALGFNQSRSRFTVPLYFAPAASASVVTKEMVERASIAAFRKSVEQEGQDPDALWAEAMKHPDKDAHLEILRELIRAALTAALEPRP